MTNPVDNHELYDVIVLGGQQSPGVCKVGMPTRNYGWEKSEPAGSDGGEVVNKGKKLLEFDCEIYLWKEVGGVDHFARWETWKQVLNTPIAKNAPKALDIYHPQLDALGVTSVVAASWNEPAPDGRGGATVKIHFIEYAPAKKKATGSGKPNASVGLVFTLAGPMTQDQITAFQAQNGYDPRDAEGFYKKAYDDASTTPPAAPTVDPYEDPNRSWSDALAEENDRSAGLE